MVHYNLEYLRETWGEMLQQMQTLKRYADKVRWYYKAERHKMFWQDMCPAYAREIQNEWNAHWYAKFKKVLG